MSDFIARMTEKARMNPKRIAFPESASVPILKCCARVVEEKIGTPVLVGSPEAVEALAKENGVSTAGFEYFDNTSEMRTLYDLEYVPHLYLLDETGIIIAKDISVTELKELLPLL